MSLEENSTNKEKEENKIIEQKENPEEKTENKENEENKETEEKKIVEETQEKTEEKVKEETKIIEESKPNEETKEEKKDEENKVIKEEKNIETKNEENTEIKEEKNKEEENKEEEKKEEIIKEENKENLIEEKNKEENNIKEENNENLVEEKTKEENNIKEENKNKITEDTLKVNTEQIDTKKSKPELQPRKTLQTKSNNSNKEDKRFSLLNFGSSLISKISITKQPEIETNEDDNENSYEQNLKFLKEIQTNPKYEKLLDLKLMTETELQKTVKNKNDSSKLKSLVSKNNRFNYDGYDLDLSYITTRIIAMAFPSTAIESYYRNDLDEVKKFLNTRHKNHYKVYNLCEEKKYPKDTFFKQGYYPFKDHEVPTIETFKIFCEDAKNFLDEDENNVVVVHCLAGTGRTGTFIVSLLLYLKVFKTQDECLKYYSLMRVGNEKGVTNPSQLRYINYFDIILKNNISLPMNNKTILIRKIKMFTVPFFAKLGTSLCPSFTIKNGDKIYKQYDHAKKENYEVSSRTVEFKLNLGGFKVSGDVLVTFVDITFFSKDKMFYFWFNTNFIPESGKFELKKEDIDRAFKDKKHKIYSKNFKIEVEYIYI